ncbi:MAG TPA: PEGA domain-containing protein, partial [Kofleriaceae bacterium]
DAPVDAKGVHIFADVPPRTRMRLRTAQTCVLQYAFDGTRFVVRVRDSFGSITRETILRFLHKSLHADEAVDRRAGGAGLGLYLVASSASLLMFELVPGTMTSVTCLFDTREPSQVGVITYSPTGHRPTPPARRRLSSRHRLRLAAITGAVLVFAAGLGFRQRAAHAPAHLSIATTQNATIRIDGGIVATGAFDGKLEAGRTVRISAQLEGYEPRRATIRLAHGSNKVDLTLTAPTTLVLDSTPNGAHVAIDGRPLGTTPVRIAVAPNSRPNVVFDHDGYVPASVTIASPHSGESRTIVQPLELDPQLVRVHVTSTPPGAAIVLGATALGPDRTFTPADVYLKRNQPQTLTLIMPKHAPLMLPTFTPTAETSLDKHGTLAAAQ